LGSARISSCRVGQTDGRADGSQRLVWSFVIDGRRTMCITGLTVLCCWSQVTDYDLGIDHTLVQPDE